MTAEDLELLRSVRRADVYKAGRQAALLRREASGIVFEYVADYLGSGGPAVATTLPLTDEPTHTHAGAVPPFFAGLLPEGRRLSGLRRAVKTSADDELSLLLAIGRDTVGDVQVVPEGEEPVPAEPAVTVAADWSEVRFAEVAAEAGVVDAVGIPGVQDKVSARMIAVPVGWASERYLLKLDPPEYPLLVHNEAFFLGLARRARMESASAEIVYDADVRPGLLVRRFDRVRGPGGATMALACEDACQVLARWPADKYNLTAEEVVVGLASRCVARPVALRSLYQQTCFAWLTGNGDLHAKNLSILAAAPASTAGAGEWRISPAYDLPSTAAHGDTSLALPLQGRTRDVSRRLLLDFAGGCRVARKGGSEGDRRTGRTHRFTGDRPPSRSTAVPGPGRVRPGGRAPPPSPPGGGLTFAATPMIGQRPAISEQALARERPAQALCGPGWIRTIVG